MCGTRWMVSLVVAAALTLGGAAGCKKDATEEAPAGGAPAAKDQPRGEPAQAPAAEPAQAPAAEPAQAPAGEEPSAAAIVDKAIAAMGGLEAVQKALSAYTWTTRGTFGGQPYVMTTSWKAPDQLVMAFEHDEGTMGYVGDACWHRMADLVMDCMEEDALGAKETQYVVHLSNLYPLKEEGVNLAPYGRGEVDGQPAVGVKVSKEGAPIAELIFWFDKESGLLRKVAWDGRMGSLTGKFETLPSDYRDVGGVQVPGRSRMTLNGKVLIDETTEQDPKLGSVDAAVFERPAMGALGQVKVREQPVSRVAAKTVVGPYDALGEPIGALYAWAVKVGVLPMGPPTMVYRKGPGQVADPAQFETELWIPVAVLAGDQPALEGGVTLKEVPATTIAVIAKQGPYDQAGAAIGELMAWVGANGYEVAGPPAMTSYSDPSKVPADKLLFEVWVPVAKKE